VGDNAHVAHLDVIAGPDRGIRLDLPPGEPQMLGRSTEALPCTDPTVSRRHAELTPARDGWIIRDLASRHGTWLNGVRVRDAVHLRDGDRIRCGDSELVYRQATDAAAPSSVQPDAGMAPADHDGHGLAERMAAVSHAIKNILQGLRGGADAVEMSIARGDLAMARQGWPILARNLDRISALTLNMLAWSRERPLDREPTDLNALIREVAASVTSESRRIGATVEVSLDDALPQAHVDPTAIHQALINLILNAIEAVPAKGGRIRISSAVSAAGDHAVIRVDDNGPGIPAEIRDRLFQPFVSSKGQRGTGLGLAVTRMLVVAHGGTITHVDAPSGGTRMEISLPLHAPADDPGDTKAPHSVPDAGIDF
jgi:signal transduction histidine kinase